MQFIEKYKKLITGEGDDFKGFTDAPTKFVEASAIYVVSTLIGRGYEIKSFTDSNIWDRSSRRMQGTPLNVWFMILGPSRVSRKTTTTNFALYYLNEICEETTLPYSFTPERLISTLSEMNRGNNMTHATWINDEVSGFFESLSKKDYMATTNTFLSKIYDGDTYERGTITRGEEVIQNPYLTTFVGSTYYLPTLFDQNMVRQGFLNRFMYVTGTRGTWEPKRRKNLTDPEIDLLENLLEWGQELYAKDNTTVVAFTSDAKKKLNQYTKKKEDMIKDDDKKLGIRNGYCGQLPNFAERLGGIFRVSRMDAVEHQQMGSRPLVVKENDIERAIGYTDVLWNEFNKVVNKMKTTAVSRDAFTDENLKKMVLGTITDKNSEITRSKLLTETGLLSERLQKHIDTLKEERRISSQVVKDGQGRPTTYYSINGEEDES